MLELKDDKHYAVTVQQQLALPFHFTSETPADGSRLIPLGQFSKIRRPDMQVAGPDGLLLPVLNRDLRARAIAIMLSVRWQNRLNATAGDSGDRAIFGIIQFYLERVAKFDRRAAYQEVKQLRLVLEQILEKLQMAAHIVWRAKDILGASEFWAEIWRLAETTIRVAELKGAPGDTYVVTTTYTERFRYSRGKLLAIRTFLGSLGIDCVQISRPTSNIGQARSLWLSHSVPSGLEPVRFYWQTERHNPSIAERVESDRAVIGRRVEAGTAIEQEDSALLDFQIAPSASIFAAMSIALLLWPIGVYIFQRTPPGPNLRPLPIALATVVSGVPGASAGALAYMGQTFIRRASRGPRFILVCLSGTASLLAVVISLKTGGPQHLLHFLAYGLSIVALFSAGIFGYIQFGPRWRKSSRSRLRRLTRGQSPEKCRNWQTVSALAFLVAWTVVVTAYALVMYRIGHHSVFSKQFPHNVWHALRSWFV